MSPTAPRWPKPTCLRSQGGATAITLAIVLFSAASTKGADTEQNARPGHEVQSLETSAAERPWAKDVSEARQKQANRLFNEANALLDKSSFKEAADKYKAALKVWDHPSIHYNLALVLDVLDEHEAMRDHLIAAMRYGEGPLDDVRMYYAQHQLQQLEQLLARVEITCEVPSATVKLDDTVVLSAPGRYEGYVTPGDRWIHATSPDYKGRDFPIRLEPGKLNQINVQFYTDEQLTEKHSRWPFWIPITVTVAGAAMTGLGAAFLVQSNAKLEQFDQQVGNRGDCNAIGCHPDPALSDLRNTGQHYKTAAIVMLPLGATMFTTGVTLMLLDLPVARRLTPEEYRQKISFTPSLGPGYAGLAAGAQF